jgi:hypothetical protein
MCGNKYCLIGRQAVVFQPRRAGIIAPGGFYANGFLVKFRPF